MGLVFDRQTGMFRRAVLRLIEDVFSPADEFHNCQGEIRKSDWVGFVTGDEKGFERPRVGLGR